jgi:hypothetical protein
MWVALAAAHAEDVYRDGRGNSLALKQEPCRLPAELLEHARIRPQFVDDRGLRRAVLRWEGRTLEACYAVRGGLVRAIDEEGQNTHAIAEVDFNEEAPDGT